jgi:hypothetical protein
MFMPQVEKTAMSPLLTWLLTLGLILWLTLPVRAEPMALRLGFYLPGIRDANLVDLRVSLGVWMEEISRPYGLKVGAATFADLQAVRAAVDSGEINFISAPGMELAELFTPAEIRAGYARRQNGLDEGIALIVAQSSGISRVDELKGKRVIRLARDRLSEYFLETQCMKSSRRACAELFSLSEEERDIQSVYNVFFGRADAALVRLATLRTAEELNPQISERLKTLLEWRAKATLFSMMTRHSDDSYRKLILNSVREAMKTARGRQILEVFKTDYLEPVDAEALKPYWALLREYRDLRHAMGARKR